MMILGWTYLRGLVASVEFKDEAVETAKTLLRKETDGVVSLINFDHLATEVSARIAGLPNDQLAQHIKATCTFAHEYFHIHQASAHLALFGLVTDEIVLLRIVKEVLQSLRREGLQIIRAPLEEWFIEIGEQKSLTQSTLCSEVGKSLRGRRLFSDAFGSITNFNGLRGLLAAFNIPNHFNLAGRFKLGSPKSKTSNLPITLDDLLEGEARIIDELSIALWGLAKCPPEVIADVKRELNSFNVYTKAYDYFLARTRRKFDALSAIEFLILVHVAMWPDVFTTDVIPVDHLAPARRFALLVEAASEMPILKETSDYGPYVDKICAKCGWSTPLTIFPRLDGHIRFDSAPEKDLHGRCAMFMAELARTGILPIPSITADPKYSKRVRPWFYATASKFVPYNIPNGLDVMQSIDFLFNTCLLECLSKFESIEEPRQWFCKMMAQVFAPNKRDDAFAGAFERATSFPLAALKTSRSTV